MDQYAELAKEEMEQNIQDLANSLATLRTGRASPALLNNLTCEYYGDRMLVKDIASIKVPEPRQLLISPYDKNDVKSIVAAINSSDIGINPIVDGTSIRLIMPALTGERRKELVKKSKTYCDERKVNIRNIRRQAIDGLKAEEYPEDLQKKAEADIQKVTDEAIAKIDKLFKEKETEIMSM